MTLKIKVTVTTKRPLSNLPNKLFDKTILQNYFLNCFSYKVWEKSLLGWKHVLRKRLKKNPTNCRSDASFCHKTAYETTRLLPERSNLIQNNFFTWKYNLHKNFCYGIHQQIRILRFQPISSQIQNRLNGEFYWPNFFHYGFKI